MHTLPIFQKAQLYHSIKEYRMKDEGVVYVLSMAFNDILREQFALIDLHALWPLLQSRF